MCLHYRTDAWLTRVIFRAHDIRHNLAGGATTLPGASRGAGEGGRAFTAVPLRRRAVYYAVSSATSRQLVVALIQTRDLVELGDEGQEAALIGIEETPFILDRRRLARTCDRRGVTMLTAPPTLTETATATLTAGI